jgi:hypothetical protein
MPETKPLPLKSEWLRANVISAPVQVDRQARVIRGMVLAQEGPFKTPGRGEFNQAGLKEVVRLVNAKPKGLKSRFAHPTLSDDGIGKYLGRVREAWLGRARNAGGAEVVAVRGDLYFDDSAFDTPSGDLASYVMTLAEGDSDAISSSLVVQPELIYRTDKKGKPLTDDNGNELPPLWIPKVLHASDLVDEGDAVDGLLSAQLDPDALPDAAVRRGAELLDRFFGGQPRPVVEARCQAWLCRYLDLRFGAPEPPPAPAVVQCDTSTEDTVPAVTLAATGAVTPVVTPRLDKIKARLRESDLAVALRRRQDA